MERDKDECIYLRNNSYTSLESTAAYIMSIHPLNVAFQKSKIIKHVTKTKIYQQYSKIQIYKGKPKLMHVLRYSFRLMEKRR